MSRSIAHDDRDRQTEDAFLRFRIKQQRKVFAANRDRFLIAAGCFIGDRVRFGQESHPAPFIRRLRAISAIRLAFRESEQHGYFFTGGGEEIRDIARRRQRIAVRHVKRQSIRKNPAGMQQRESAIAQRFSIQSQAYEPIGFITECGGSKLNRIFEVTALHLEMMGRQIHAFGPDNSR